MDITQSLKTTLTFLALTSFQASAISVFEGKIQSLLSGPNYTHYLLIQVDRSTGTMVDEKLECNNPHIDYVIDLSTEMGKFYGSMALTAYASGKTVNIQGYDDECSGNIEKLRHILLK